MAVSFKSLVEKHQFTEQKVLDILKAAQIVDTKDTIDRVRARQFSDEIIENGFNVIVDYVSTGLIQDGDWQKASELFKGHQSQKEKVAKEVAVTDVKAKATDKEKAALTVQKKSELAHLLAEELGDSSPSEEDLNKYAELIEMLAKETADPVTLLANAVICVRDTAQQGINMALAKAVFSQPLDCTVKDVLAEVRKMESEAQNVIQ
jgi:hypothetical protein